MYTKHGSSCIHVNVFFGVPCEFGFPVLINCFSYPDGKRVQFNI